MKAIYPKKSISNQIILITAIGLMILGFVSRLLPVFIDGRLFLQFPIDDGYYMLTMARNIAMGLGLSVSNGEIATNGTQPFVTLLWGVFYWLSSGDKEAGILLIHIFEIVCSIAAAFFLYRISNRLLPKFEGAPLVALWISALWFVAESTVYQSMNMLETGPLALGILIFLYVYIGVEEKKLEDQNYSVWFGLGAILGLLFWIRNDTAFLAIAVSGSRLLFMTGKNPDQMRKLFFQAVIVGAVSGGIATPWLFFNYYNFGHIMPLSGVAESLMKSYPTQNVYPTIREFATTIFYIVPGFDNRFWMKYSIMVPAISGLIPLVVLILCHKKFQWPDVWGRFIVVFAIYLGLVIFFYALFFGARWMLPRYFFPFSSITTLVCVGLVVSIYGRVSWMKKLGLPYVVIALLSYLAVQQHIAIYKSGDEHKQKQLWQWVDSNVDESVWVAGWQTGIVGYFHDKTINLDGKVNPDALASILSNYSDGYMRDLKAEYILDWKSIVRKEDHFKAVDEYYEVIFEKDTPSIAVLARRK